MNGKWVGAEGGKLEIAAAPYLCFFDPSKYENVTASVASSAACNPLLCLVFLFRSLHSPSNVGLW